MTALLEEGGDGNEKGENGDDEKEKEGEDEKGRK
jgi:hypothetical protein